MMRVQQIPGTPPPHDTACVSLEDVPRPVELPLFAGVGVQSSSVLEATPAQGVQHRVEKWNEQTNRALRITQRELAIIGGCRVVTKIEVLERREGGTECAVFSVRHTHGAVWRKQLQVHKNLLFACILVGVSCPLEIPEDSERMFNSVDNPHHVHIYLEKIIPHFRFTALPSEVSAFWWRAVGNGALVLQNWQTGRLIILPCKAKGVPAAANTLERALTTMSNMPSLFWDEDSDYKRINVAADEEACSPGAPTNLDTLERAAEAIQSWALEDGVSPWLTTLIVKCRGARRSQILQYRYSVGVDVAPGGKPLTGGEEDSPGSAAEPQMFVAVQVHCNEPLSRELKAYPICMVPVAVESLACRELTALYLRSLWFLRKLYEYHVAFSEQEEHRTAAYKSQTKPTFLRTFILNDSKDLDTKHKMVGGARLARPRFQPGLRMAIPRHSSAPSEDNLSTQGGG